MKILYISCHSVLEYDELKLFEELNIDYFSLGSYIDPLNPADPIRPALTHIPNEWCYANAPDRNNIPKEFFDRFDVIIIMHIKEWIIDNWDKIKNKIVIWRTIGQSTPAYERALLPYRKEGLKIVRYSQREAYIQDQIGCDAVIEFYKDENEFNMWNGLEKQIMVLNQDMSNRLRECNYEAFLKFAENLPVKLYGTKNEGSGNISGGYLSYEAMKQKMRDCRVYFYAGTQPASYTLNFIEALMTGIPILALGSDHATSMELAGKDTYQIPDIIQNGVNGFYSDDISQLRDWAHVLLKDEKTAARIGAMGRQTAIQNFGKNNIKLKWEKLLKKYNVI